ncbi:TIGR02450 family Trp-rich protein [Halopseudomonas aestusnigri]
MITDVEVDEEGQVIGCEIEAVLSKRQAQIDWRELKDDARWLQGWK